MMVELEAEYDADSVSDEYLKEEAEKRNQEKNSRYPKSVYYIFGNEMCERFSFYGLRTVLFLYLHDFLLFNEDASTAIYHVFVFSAYIFPILGAVLSDAYIGKYNTILRLSIVYSIGSVILSITAVPGVTGIPPHWWGMAFGLLLIAIGTGGIKPCVSSFGGDQFNKDQTALIASFFAFFYFSINFGSVFSEFLTPILRVHVGFWAAFGVPALLLWISTIIFRSGKKHYKMVPVGQNIIASFIRVLKTGVMEAMRKDKIKVDHWLDRCEPQYGKALVEDVKSLWNVAKVLLPLPCFWALFDQTSSRWIAQGLKMDRNFFFGLTIAADQVQAVNPLMLLPLIPLYDKIIYPFCRSRNINILPLNRMKLGMFLASITYVISAFLEIAINTQGTISIAWQLVPYFVLSNAEILVSISGLEFSYSQAPESMKSVVMAIWLLAIAAGNAFVAIIASGSLFESRVVEFFFYAALMLVFMFIFIFVVRNYTYRSTPVDLASVEDDDDEFYAGNKLLNAINMENMKQNSMEANLVSQTKSVDQNRDSMER